MLLILKDVGEQLRHCEIQVRTPHLELCACSVAESQLPFFWHNTAASRTFKMHHLPLNETVLRMRT